MEQNGTACLKPIAAAILGVSLASGTTYAATLEEVVVVAQRRDQLLEEVPISITAISGEAIADANIYSANQLSQLVPGLRIDSAGYFAQPTIRGIGSSIAAVGVSSNVATYVDGFYVASQNSTDAGLANIESVQVLKGPQGTLFGRNAAGGAILIETVEPSQETSGRVKYSYADYNTEHTEGYFTTGLTDSAAFDVSGYYSDSDGYVENIATGDDDAAQYTRWRARTAVLWDISDNASLKLAYERNDWDDQRPFAMNTYNGLGDPVPVAFGVGFSTDKPHKIALDDAFGSEVESDNWFLTGRFDLGWANLVSYTMYGEEDTSFEWDLDGSAAIAPNPPWWAVTSDTSKNSFSQEFNLSGNYEDTLEWVAGVYFFEYEDTFNSLTSKIPPFGLVVPVDVYDYISADISTWAAFADVTYHITEQWSLILGVRYSDEQSKGTMKIDPGNLLTLFPPPIDPGVYTRNETWTDTSPRAVIRYQLNDESNIYLSYTKGFKAGLIAVTDTVVPLPVADPEEVNAWELGYKYAGDFLRLSVASYYYDYSDLQVANYLGTTTITTNAAESEIYGAELQLDAPLGEHWLVNFGINYLKAEYDEYLTAPYWEQDLTAFPPAFVVSPGDASGNEMQRSPELTGNLGLQYETPLADGTFRAIGNYYYTSSFYLDPANQFEQDSYALLNATVSWTMPNEKITFGVFGTNLTDEEYKSQVTPGPPAINQTWGEPRSYGVSIDYAL